MGYSTGYFSKIWHFLKMAVTRNFFVGIDSNLLQSIRTSICMRQINDKPETLQDQDWRQQYTGGYSVPCTLEQALRAS